MSCTFLSLNTHIYFCRFENVSVQFQFTAADIYLDCLQPNLGGEGLISDPQSRWEGHLGKFKVYLFAVLRRKRKTTSHLRCLTWRAVTARNFVSGILRNWDGRRSHFLVGSPALIQAYIKYWRQLSPIYTICKVIGGGPKLGCTAEDWTVKIYLGKAQYLELVRWRC